MKEEYMTEKDAILQLNETLKLTNYCLNGVIKQLEKMRKNIYD